MPTRAPPTMNAPVLTGCGLGFSVVMPRVLRSATRLGAHRQRAAPGRARRVGPQRPRPGAPRRRARARSPSGGRTTTQRFGRPSLVCAGEFNRSSSQRELVTGFALQLAQIASSSARGRVHDAGPTVRPCTALPAHAVVALACPYHLSVGTAGPPKFLGDPIAHVPWSKTPEELPGTTEPSARGVLPSAVVRASASSTSTFSGLNTRPMCSLCTLRVSVSGSRATLGSGWGSALAGRGQVPRTGSLSKVSASLLPP